MVNPALLSRVLEYLYPDAVSLRDYRVEDNGTGPAITFWNTGVLGTQPNQGTLDTTEVSAGFVAWLAEHGGNTTATQRRMAREGYDLTDWQARLFRAVGKLLVDTRNARSMIEVGVAQQAWNPASMANAAGVTSPNFTVTGAAFGDAVLVGVPYSLAGIIACGFVVSANTVAIRLHNGTGSAVDLANGAWSVAVYRRVAPITYADARDSIRNAIDGDA